MWWAGHVGTSDGEQKCVQHFGGETRLGVPGRVWELKSNIVTEPKQVGQRARGIYLCDLGQEQVSGLL